MKVLISFVLTVVIFVSCKEKQKETMNNSGKNNSVTHAVDIKTESFKRIEELTTEQMPKVQDSNWVIETMKENPYPYDTLLSFGYHLKHKVFRETGNQNFVQSLTLMKGIEKIKEFGYFSFGLPYKNMGYVGADYDESFVMVYSFGSGNSNRIQLIEKETGNELKKGTWVDVNESEQILLYLENDHQDSEVLKIYDIKNQNEILIEGFTNSISANEEIGGLRDCVQIDTVTSKIITLKVGNNEEQLRKRYAR